jgi:predicted Zn-dependent peptidase
MTAPMDVTRSERLAEEVHTGRLSNGLTVAVLPKRGFFKKHAVLATRYGSIDNVFRAPGEPEPREVPAGIAHFLEHKLFEEEGGNAFDRFSKNGAYCNAFTSYTTTAYLFSCTDLFDENLGLLVDFVGDPYFTEAAIARERQIISQEIRMYEDSPDWRGFQALLEALYVRHPVRVDITGTVDSIARITRADLERCYRTFYNPTNMILFATGDLEPARVADEAERAFARRRYGAGGPVLRVLPDEPAAVAAREVRTRLDVSQPRLLLGWKDTDVGRGGIDLLRKEVEITFAIELLFGRSSDFYQRCYESGLIDATFSASYTGEVDHGYTAIAAETESPERLREEVLATLDAGLAAGFAPEDFARIKNKALGKFLRNFNSLEFIASSFVQGHFSGASFFDYLGAIEAATLEAVRARAAAHFRPELLAASIVEPSGGAEHGEA